MQTFKKTAQYYKFCAYGFFKNLKFFEPFLMLFFLDKGITFLQIGTLYAIREISINILEIPTGVIADLLGRRKTMIISFLSYIVSFILFYLSPSFFWLAMAMLCFSFGDAMRTGTHKAMIFDYLKLNNLVQYKVLYYGHTRSWSMIGSAISSLIAALVVIFTGNYQVVFLVSIVPYLADLILVWSYPTELDGPIKTGGILSLKQRMKIFTRETLISFKTKPIWMALLNLAAYQGYFKAIKDYLQPIILLAAGSSIMLSNQTTDKKSTVIIGALYFIIYIVSSFSSRYASKLVEWLKTPEKVINLTLFAGILTGMVCGGLISTENSVLAALLFVIIFVIQNIRKPVGTGLVADMVKNEVLATGLSVQSQFDSLFAAVFAILMGLLVDSFDIGIALTIMGLGLMLLAIFLRLKPVIQNGKI